METKVLNYKILIISEKHRGKTVYNAYCPTLGVADWGKTIEEALKNIKGAIECHLESLVKHNEPIPTEDDVNCLLATTTVSLPSNYSPTFA